MVAEFLLVFIPMFIIIDPFGVLPVFIGLTKDMDAAGRRKTVKYSVAFATLLLVVFAFAGRAILTYLTISIDALRIAGGLLLLVIGVVMLYEGDMPRSRRKGPEEPVEHRSPEDVAFVPLGTPMLAGPGAISVVIVLTGTANAPMVMLSLIIVMAICGLVIWYADLTFRLLGNAGTRALTRVMGLLASAYAVQMILDGVAGYVSSMS